MFNQVVSIKRHNQRARHLKFNKAATVGQSSSHLGNM